MSRTVCVHSILACLKKAEDILGPDREWRAIDELQMIFKERFLESKISLEGLPIESVASFYTGVINSFLAERGFNIKLSPLGADEFGVASVLDLLVEWELVGEKTTVTVDTKRYPGVHLSEGVTFLRSRKHEYPIAQIPTKSGYTVYMTPYEDEAGAFEFELLVTGQGLARAPEFYDEFKGLVFPMVDLDRQEDISWLKGLWTTNTGGRRCKVKEALQQNKLRMNEFGARAQSATAMGFALESLSVPRSPFVIDRPFLVWFVRNAGELPLFAAQVTQENWKDPGNLS